METTTNLREETINNLKELVKINNDSYEGFKKVADEISNPSLSEAFQKMSNERKSFASNLRLHLNLNDELESDDYKGSLLADIHRMWIDIRSKLNQNNELVILAEVERGEEKIANMYEKVLKDIPGNPLNSVLLEQYSQIKKTRDSVSNLKELVIEDTQAH